jgi:hypothetical protein
MKKILKLIAVFGFSVLAGCNTLKNNPEFQADLKAAKTINVLISPIDHVFAFQTERSLFMKYKKGEINDAQKLLQQTLLTTASQRMGEFIATTLREQGYIVNMPVDPSQNLSTLTPADITLVISKLSITLTAETDLVFGKRYRIFINGYPSIYTRSQKIVAQESRTYPYLRDQKQGFVGAADVVYPEKILEGFDKAMQGWVQIYVVRDLERESPSGSHDGGSFSVTPVPSIGIVAAARIAQ